MGPGVVLMVVEVEGGLVERLIDQIHLLGPNHRPIVDLVVVSEIC